jgi:dihydrofolate reductase
MGKLIYSAITSLDGYVADADGGFEWAAPDEEVHAFVNELERPIGTYLYGRRVYETMSYWETVDATDASPAVQDYATIWRAADKIVYSRTLGEVTTTRTQLEREFIPEAVRHLKSTATSDLSIGGATLGGQALLAGVVDEFHQFLAPITVGGGQRALPDHLTTRLQLLDSHAFPNGFVHLHYQVDTP